MLFLLFCFCRSLVNIRLHFNLLFFCVLCIDVSQFLVIITIEIKVGIHFSQFKKFENNINKFLYIINGRTGHLNAQAWLGKNSSGQYDDFAVAKRKKAGQFLSLTGNPKEKKKERRSKVLMHGHETTLKDTCPQFCCCCLQSVSYFFSRCLGLTTKFIILWSRSILCLDP